MSAPRLTLSLLILGCTLHPTNQPVHSTVAAQPVPKRRTTSIQKPARRRLQYACGALTLAAVAGLVWARVQKQSASTAPAQQTGSTTPRLKEQSPTASVADQKLTDQEKDAHLQQIATLHNKQYSTWCEVLDALDNLKKHFVSFYVDEEVWQAHQAAEKALKTKRDALRKAERDSSESAASDFKSLLAQINDIDIGDHTQAAQLLSNYQQKFDALAAECKENTFQAFEMAKFSCKKALVCKNYDLENEKKAMQELAAIEQEAEAAKDMQTLEKLQQQRTALSNRCWKRSKILVQALADTATKLHKRSSELEKEQLEQRKKEEEHIQHLQALQIAINQAQKQAVLRDLEIELSKHKEAAAMESVARKMSQLQECLKGRRALLEDREAALTLLEQLEREAAANNLISWQDQLSSLQQQWEQQEAGQALEQALVSAKSCLARIGQQ